MFYCMNKLDFPQFAICPTWMVSSMQTTNKPVLKVSWSPCFVEKTISMPTVHNLSMFTTDSYLYILN